MRTRTLAVAGALLAALVAVAVVALSLPRTQAVAQDAPAHVQIKLFDRDGPYTKMIDLGSKGFSAGDSILEHHPLADAETRKQAGRAVTHIRVVRTLSKDNWLGIVDCTIELPRGDLVFYGAFRFAGLAKGATLPVTGGTGDYTGARGTVTIRLGKLGGREGGYLTFDVVPA
jgi:hypothetical protein